MAQVTPTEAVKRNLIQSARFGVDDIGLKAYKQCTDGLDIPQATKHVQELQGSDKFRIASRMKRAPVPDVDEAERPMEIGDEWIGDAWGPVRDKSILDGSSYYEMSLTEVKTGVTVWRHVAHVTSEEWKKLGHNVEAFCNAYHRKFRRARFDAASQTRSRAFKDSFEEGLKAWVTVAPGGRHQGVAISEALMDPATRKGEEFCKRARKRSAYVLAARQYARNIRNHGPSRIDANISRMEHFTGRRSNFKKSKAAKAEWLIFGCRVALLNDERERQQKGSGDSERCSEGEYLGVDGASAIVRKDNGEVVRRTNIGQLNEWQMAIEGLPDGAVTLEMEVQTEMRGIGDLPILGPAPEPIRVEKEPRPVVSEEDAVIGQDYEFYYLVEKRGGKKLPAEMHEVGKWYVGKIVAKRDIESTGARHHLIAWEGPWAGDFDWVDLADGRRYWRPREAPSKPAQTSEKQTSRVKRGKENVTIKARTSKHKMHTRARSQATASTANAEGGAMNEMQDIEIKARKQALVAEVHRVYEAGLLGRDGSREIYAYQAFGLEEHEVFVADTECTLRPEFLESLAKPVDAEANAARPLGEVEIDTPAGKIRRTPPRNDKERKDAPDAEQWAESDRKAWSTITDHPDNYMSTYTKAKAMGLLPTPAVPTRKYKKDAKTNALAERNGRKSRFSLNNVVYKRMRMKRGEMEDHPFSAPQADDVLKNTFLSDVCERRRGMSKADVGNAYI